MFEELPLAQLYSMFDEVIINDWEFAGTYADAPLVTPFVTAVVNLYGAVALRTE
jgi:hypothetical protein